MSYERDHGFNRLIFWYVGLFQRLLACDPVRARREFDAWLGHDNTLFYRLRVWACGLPLFLPAGAATQTLATLNDEAFWTVRGQRDLLLSLKVRWMEFDGELRRSVEKRLLKGPPRFKFMSQKDHREWRARTVLERVLWLIEQGCVFQRPVAIALDKARTTAPRWEDAFAAHAVDSHEARGGFLSTNADFDHIKDAPIRELLSLCLLASGRDHQFLVERDPLAGLVEKRPIRVLRALLLDTLPNDQARSWTWSKFLQSNARREDKPRLTCLIAYRLATIPSPIFALIVQPLSYWLENHTKILYESFPASVGNLSDRIIAALANADPGTDGLQKRSSDWPNAALSSPSGHLVQALLRDPMLEGLAVGAGLPDEWKRRTERSLTLPGDHGVFALYQVTHSLGWLFGRDRAWTEQHILSALDSDGDRREAVLAAFLVTMGIGERALYERLKVHIFKLIGGELSRPKADPRSLMAFTLLGWRTTDEDGRWLSDMEMRTALVRGQQELRTTVLWEIGRWDFAEKNQFLAEVWPLQLAARSGTVTDRLCHIAFHDPHHFAELAQTIMPFLTPIHRGALMFAAGVPNANEIIAANPQIAMALYWRILPEDSADWPYDAHQGLEYLYKNIKSLRSDPRMIELMRRRRKGYF